MKPEFNGISNTKIKTVMLIILSVFFFSSSSWAATYYVDKTAGKDSNPGSQNQPWEHCPGMVGWSGNATVKAGDVVYFDKGDTWTGGGGSALLSAVGGVLYDGETWGSGGSKAILRATGGFIQAVANIGADHSTYETTIKGFEIDCNGIGVSGANINWPNSSDLTGAIKRFQNLDIHDLYQGPNGTFYNIKVGARTGHTTRNVELIGNHIYNTDTQCLVVYAAINCPTCLIDQVLVSGNTIGPNCYPASSTWNGTGILLKNRTRNVTVEYNTIYETALNNIIIQDDGNSGSDGNIGLKIRYNKIFSAVNKHGISVQTPRGADFELYGNFIYNNDKAGLEFSSVCGGTIKAKVYNNTFYNNAWGDIRISDATPRVEINNNIVYSRTGQTPLSAAPGTITTHSNNLFFRSDVGTLVSYGGSTYTSGNLSSFESTAIAGNPQFTAPSSGDFSLQSTSPAIPIKAGALVPTLPLLAPPKNLRLIFK